MSKKVIILLLIIFSITGCSVNNKNDEIQKQEIKLEKKSGQLVVGDTYKIDLNGDGYTFKSSDPNIAVVDEKGNITAKDTGKVNITISSKNYYDANFELEIFSKVESVSINQKNISVEKGKEIELDYTINPPNSKINTSEWISQDSNIAEVVDNQLIAKKAGKTKITLIINGYVEDTINVEVHVNPVSISFEKDSLNMFVDDIKNLKVIIKPDDVTNKNVKYVSGNENIIKVSNTGIIKAISKGDTYVEAITVNNIKTKINIHVEPVVPEKISFETNILNINLGSKTKVETKIEPINSENKTIKYTSSNPNVVEIDKEGNLYPKKIGKSIISAQTYNGKTATMSVYVKNATYNKTAIFFGDSITYGERGTPSGYSWANYIGDHYDLKKTVNAGIRNWLISNYFNKRWIVEEVKNHKNEKYDYVIMHGGTNDIHNGASLGTFKTNDFSGKYNTKTFLGGLETYIYTVKTYWPNAKIGYIINYETPLSSENRIKLSAQYYTEMKKVLNKWGIKYIDLFSGSTDNGIKYNDLLKVDTKTYLPDGLHLNSEGYNLISPYIYNWMNSL